MTVKDFVNGFKDARDKEKYVGEHIANKYIPFDEKIGAAKTIVDRSHYKEVDGEKTYVKDSPLEYLLIMISMTELYTDIELSSDNRLKGFDMLESIGFYEVFLKVLGAEASRFNTILAMVRDDTEDLERNFVSYIDRKLKIFSSMFKDIDIDNMKELIENATINQS